MNKYFYFFIIALLMTSCSQDESNNVEIKTSSANSEIKQELNHEFITLKSGVIVEKNGADYIMEGDILLSDEQLKKLDETGSIFGNIPQKEMAETTLHPTTNLPLELNSAETKTKALGIYPTPYNLWAMIRFVYNAQLTDYQKACIRRALLNIQSSTNARFYNATGQPTRDPVYGFDYPYLDFTPIGDATSSSSYVGRIGGRQQVSLADFAFNYYDTSTIEHEIGHAIGMLHEQCRPDRDNYVTINSSNLKPAGASNFTKRTTNYYMIGAYDFNSIMGYSSYTTSTDAVYNINAPMYNKKDGTNIYQGWEFSNLDRMWVNSFYIPYIARSDVYAELDQIVYKPDNSIMTPEERLQFQAQLNNGNPNPPAGGRIPNDF